MVKHDFGKILRQYAALKAALPALIGEEAVNFAKDNFRKQGFHDATVQKWQKRSSKAPRNKGRALLVDTGRLKRSVRVTRISGSKVYIGSDVPYAQIHNEGGQVTGNANVRAHQRRTRTGRTSVSAHTRKIDFKMPRRQYIGPSVELSRRINKMLSKRLSNALKM